MIKKAFELQSRGRKVEAAKYYLYLIKQKIKDYRVFSNYAGILQSIGKLKEAAISLRKAIELYPDNPIYDIKLEKCLIEDPIFLNNKESI